MTEEELRKLAASVAAEAAQAAVIRATDIAAKIAAEVASKEALKLMVKEVVDETLERFGFDTSQPLQMQQNVAFLQSWRESSSAIKRQMWFVGGGILLAGLFGLVAAWVKAP